MDSQPKSLIWSEVGSCLAPFCIYQTNQLNFCRDDSAINIFIIIIIIIVVVVVNVAMGYASQHILCRS